MTPITFKLIKDGMQIHAKSFKTGDEMTGLLYYKTLDGLALSKGVKMGVFDKHDEFHYLGNAIYLVESKLQERVNAFYKERNIRAPHEERGRVVNKKHRAGDYDITVFAGIGNTFFIEVKTKDGRLTKGQEAHKLWAKSMGYPCYEVDNWDDFIKINKLRGIV